MGNNNVRVNRSRNGRVIDSIEVIGSYACFDLCDTLDLEYAFSKATDPIEDARDGLSRSEAEDVASEDPALIYLCLTPTSVAKDGGETWEAILSHLDITE